MDNIELDKALNTGRQNARKKFDVPNWSYIFDEMGKKGATLEGLIDDYREKAGSDAMSRSEFRRRYEDFLCKRGIVMRKIHFPGQDCFIDYAGDHPQWVDRDTGEVHVVELFVAALGHSRKAFCVAVESQNMRDFITAHSKMTSYFGCASMFWVPDNLKAAVIGFKNNKPILNPNYKKCADYYGVHVAPARRRKPKDKATVEVHVKIVQRFILWKLRKRTFFSLDELNAAISILLEELNSKVMRSVGKSRNELFEQFDRPAMQAVPAEAYEYADWKIQVRVPQDYHVPFQDAFYSVPYSFVGDVVDIKGTDTIVTMFFRDRQIAMHSRKHAKGDISSNKEHMPAQHRAHATDSLDDLRAWAPEAGEHIARFLETHIATHNHMPATLLAGRSLKRLLSDYGRERLNAACLRALQAPNPTISSVRTILEKGLDGKSPSAQDDPSGSSPTHENVRGKGYYIH